MSVAVVVAPIFILLLLLVAVIPVVIGMYIYKDARKRGMNAALWTLIGILAPGFIGLIVYLIVRGEHPDLQCFSCGKPVSEAFAVCPYCGSALKEKCANCGYSLDAGWAKCPSCGSDIPEEQRRATVTSSSGKGLKKLLALVIAVPLVLMVLLFAATCLFTSQTAAGSSWINTYDVAKEDFIDSKISREILSWMEECDKKGEGVYAMRTNYRMGAEAVTNCVVYRNDGYYSVSSFHNAGGWFTSDELCVEFFNLAEEGIERDYTICLFEYGITADEHPEIKIYDEIGGKPMDITIEETELMDTLLSNYFNLDESEAHCSVYIDESLTGVYHVQSTIYADQEPVESEMAQLANEDEISGESFDFFTCSGALPEAEEYTFVISLMDEDGALLFETDPISIDDHDPYATVMFYSEDDQIKYEYKESIEME